MQVFLMFWDQKIDIILIDTLYVIYFNEIRALLR